MDNQAKTQSDPNAQKGPSNKVYLLAIILLFLSNVVTAYLMYDNGVERDGLLADKEQLSNDKLAVEAELTDMLAQYDTLTTENEGMNIEIEAQKEKIKELLEQAEKHKNDAYTIYKLRKEAATLREVMKDYLRTIDSLNTANIALAAEKEQVEQYLDKEKQQNKELTGKNESLSDKVRIGSRMRAVDFAALAQRVKSNGDHRETNRARKAQKIKVCFSLDKNEVAESGMKTIYIRIITPKGDVLADGQDKEHLFDYNGIRGLYSVKRTVKYDKEELDMCFYWDVKEELAVGKYIVEAYHDEAEIGHTDFTLQ